MPRVAIAFGDDGARGFLYAWRGDDGLTGAAEPCKNLGGYMPFPCDVGIAANSAEGVITLFVVTNDRTTVLLTRDVPLTPPNVMVANLTATTTSAGLPQLSDATYVDGCPSR